MKKEHKSIGRHKTSPEKLRKNKVMLTFTDKDYEELKKFKKILGKKTITSTLDEFIKIAISIKRYEILHFLQK